MNMYYYFLFTIFAILVYMMAVDRNVITFFDLMIRYTGVQIKRAWWLVRFHPINPIPRWTLNWRAERMARQLEKSLKKTEEELTKKK